MNSVKFLRSLMKRGMLKLIDSSEEVGLSYLEKSESNLISSRILFENGRFEESVSLSYYSMYNILLALLFRVGIKCGNHSGSIILLKEIFDVDNSDLFFAKKERIDKQYYVDFNVVEKDVGELLEIAVEFKERLFDFVSRLTNERVGFYRERFSSMID